MAYWAGLIADIILYDCVIFNYQLVKDQFTQLELPIQA